MDPILVLAGVILWLAIFAMMYGARLFMEERSTIARRLTTPNDIEAARGLDPTIRVSLDDGFLKRFERIVTPQDPAERSQIQQRLVLAGYRKPSAMRVFYFSRAVLTIAMTMAAAFIVPLLAQRLPLLFNLALIMVPGIFGYLVPALWLDRQTRLRSREAEQAFPDVLDMLLICLEAGQSIDQACRRVAGEIGAKSVVLADELHLVNDELWAGKERALVFHDFADRLGVGDIKAFATVLKQSDEYGVSVAETLRVYASEMRNKRMMRAEERANLMPVKVAMGSIFFTVPPTMIIIGGPAIIMIMRTFSHL
jgi:tight adherence protein C